MTLLLSIDPSSVSVGIALWEDGVLQMAKALRSDLAGSESVIDQIYNLNVEFDEIAIESQQIYGGSSLKKKAGVIKVAQYAGIAIGRLYSPGTLVSWYLPRDWKSQVPKDVFLPRIQRPLTEEETLKVELTKNKKINHDVWDAVGIGLHHLGRLKK